MIKKIGALKMFFKWICIKYHINKQFGNILNKWAIETQVSKFFIVFIKIYLDLIILLLSCIRRYDSSAIWRDGYHAGQ